MTIGLFSSGYSLKDFSVRDFLIVWQVITQEYYRHRVPMYSVSRGKQLMKSMVPRGLFFA